jgi:hypothetical protein
MAELARKRVAADGPILEVAGAKPIDVRC